MSQAVATNTPTLQGNAEQKRPIPYRNLAVGALMNIFQGNEKLYLPRTFLILRSYVSWTAARSNQNPCMLDSHPY